jgi:flagellar hook assembly protein FlgD
LPNDVGDDAALRVNRLFQNEPNPFSPRTTVKFSLAQSGPVQIVIYDVNGRQVKKLVDGPMDPGSYSVVWDGTNDLSHRVGSGVYWSQMKAGSFVSNKKMVVLK